MSSRLAYCLITSLTLLAILASANTAGAQRIRSDEAKARACRHAVRTATAAAGIRRARDDADDRDGTEDHERNDDHGNAFAKGTKAAVMLLRCGPTGGLAAGQIIRALRTEQDTARLEALAEVFSNFRDTAVFTAQRDVALDRGASEPARIRALIGLHALRTGDHWTMTRDFHGSIDPVIGKPLADCGASSMVSDAYPFWYEGAPLPASYKADLMTLARALWSDESQPLQVRAAASCM